MTSYFITARITWTCIWHFLGFFGISGTWLFPQFFSPVSFLWSGIDFSTMSHFLYPERSVLSDYDALYDVSTDNWASCGRITRDACNKMSPTSKPLSVLSVPLTVNRWNMKLIQISCHHLCIRSSHERINFAFAFAFNFSFTSGT